MPAVLVAWGPVPVLWSSWIGQIGFFAGSLLLTLSPRIAVPLADAMAAAVGWIALSAGFGVLISLSTVVSTVVTASVVVGLTTLSGSVAQLHHARARLAAMAVEAERNRFARDLHDFAPDGDTLTVRVADDGVSAAGNGTGAGTCRPPSTAASATATGCSGSRSRSANRRWRSSTAL